MTESDMHEASEHLRARAADLVDRAGEQQQQMQQAQDATCKALRLDGGVEELQVCVCTETHLLPETPLLRSVQAHTHT